MLIGRNIVRFAVPLLLFGSVSAAVSDGLPEQRSALFISSGSSGEPSYCRGVSLGSWLLTVEHCLKESRKRLARGEKLSVSFRGQKPMAIDKEILGSAAGATPYAALMQSYGLDFVVLPIANSGVDPAVSALQIAGRVNKDDHVLVPSADGRFQQCQVTRVCGGEFSYRCANDTEPGWSGGGVWRNDSGQWKLLGVHKRGDGSEIGAATSFPTILGRSNRLFSKPDEFAETFARTRTYAYRWLPDGACLQSPPGSSLDVLMLPYAGLIQGMTTLGANYLVTFNTSNNRMCKYDVGKSKNVVCSTSPYRNDGGVNSIAAISPSLIAVAHSETSRFRGSISFAELDPSGSQFRFGVPNYPEASAKIGSVLSVIKVGSDMIAAGDRGVCKISGTNCQTICVDAPKCADQWRANGMVAVSDKEFVAVGRDYRDLGAGKTGVAACNWFMLEDGVWKLHAQCIVGRTRPIVESMRRARREFQLKAPIRVLGQTIAFASDGSPYKLVPGAAPRKILIDGLDEDSKQIEDAVRSAVVVGPTQVFVGSSDGTLRLITFQIDGKGQMGARAEPTFVLYDRGIWATEVAASNGWTAVRGQDGNVWIAHWKSVLPI